MATQTRKIPARDVREGDVTVRGGTVERVEKIGKHHVRLYFPSHSPGYATVGYAVEFALSERVEVEV